MRRRNSFVCFVFCFVFSIFFPYWNLLPLTPFFWSSVLFLNYYYSLAIVDTSFTYIAPSDGGDSISRQHTPSTSHNDLNQVSTNQSNYSCLVAVIQLLRSLFNFY